MKHKLRNQVFILLTLVAAGILTLAVAGQESSDVETGTLDVTTQDIVAVGSSFTYQGYLTDGGGPANGSYDFRFSLFNAAAVGTQYGNTDDEMAVDVVDGLFTVVISPGPGVFSSGGTRWLKIEVRPAGGGAYTTLHPRQEIRPVPQAIYAQFAGNLVDPGTTIIQVSPFDAIESDGGTNISFAARGNGRLEISRNVTGNDFVYIPVDVPAQIFGSQQQLALESMRFCYNGALSGGMVASGVIRATVRQVTNFSTGSNMLGEAYTPPLTGTDECVTVTATTPQVVTGSLWVRFEIITGPSHLAPLELGEISLTFSSDN